MTFLFNKTKALYVYERNPHNVVCIDFTNCCFNLGDILGAKHKDGARKRIELVNNSGVPGA